MIYTWGRPRRSNFIEPGDRRKYSALFLRIKLLRRISVIVRILQKKKKYKHGHTVFSMFSALFLVCNFIFGIV